MSDPLSVLRDYFISKAGMRHDEHNIIIGDLRFPRSTLTAYKQDRGRGDPYPLEALYFLLQNPLLAGAAKTRAYNEECRSHGFSRVLLVDQKDVLNFLTGKTDSSQYLVSVDELASISAAPAAKKEEKRPDKPEKRQREEPKLDMTDEAMRDAKRQFGERVAERQYQPHVGRTPAEMKQITPTDAVQPPTSVFVKGDYPITRGVLERERTLTNRGNFLNNKSGREFTHILNQIKTSFGSTSSSQNKSGSKSGTGNIPAGPQRRDRYNVEATDAYKAAGMDQVLLSAEAKGSIIGTQQKQDSGQANLTDKKKQLNQTPIIIVPQAPTSLISTINIKELLEKGVYKSPQQRKEEGAKKEETVTVAHYEEGHNYHYKVVDSAAQMKPEDWQRVVAVFAQGPAWQFKDFDLSIFGGKLVNMFNRVSAFHIEWEKEPRHANILLWNVKVLTVHRTKRHFDEKVMNTFWDNLKANRRLAVQRKHASKSA